MIDEMKEIEKGKVMCEYLFTHGIKYEWCIRHKKVLGCDESEKYYQRFKEYIGNDYCIGKNLLVQERKGERRLFLIIVPATKKVDLKSISAELNIKKLEFVKEEKMRQILHTTPGNVSVFNLIYDVQEEVQLILDEELLTSRLVAFHPLYNGMSVFMRPVEVLKFLKLCNRSYEVDNIAAKPSDNAPKKIKQL